MFVSMDRDELREGLEKVYTALSGIRHALGVTPTAAEVRDLAERWAHWDDDAQARFFVEAAKVFATFGGMGGDIQAFGIGGHLRKCECSTSAARDLVRHIAAGMEPLG